MRRRSGRFIVTLCWIPLFLIPLAMRTAVLAQPANSHPDQRLERLRATIRAASVKDPAILLKPVFRETEKTLVYSFGGINRNLLEAPVDEISPAAIPTATLSQVEAMRAACLTSPESQRTGGLGSTAWRASWRNSSSCSIGRRG